MSTDTSAADTYRAAVAAEADARGKLEPHEINDFVTALDWHPRYTKRENLETRLALARATVAREKAALAFDGADIAPLASFLEEGLREAWASLQPLKGPAPKPEPFKGPVEADALWRAADTRMSAGADARARHEAVERIAAVLEVGHDAWATLRTQRREQGLPPPLPIWVLSPHAWPRTPTKATECEALIQSLTAERQRAAPSSAAFLVELEARLKEWPKLEREEAARLAAAGRADARARRILGI